MNLNCVDDFRRGKKYVDENQKNVGDHFQYER